MVFMTAQCRAERITTCSMPHYNVVDGGADRGAALIFWLHGKLPTVVVQTNRSQVSLHAL